MEFLKFMSKFTVKIWPLLQIRNLWIRKVLWNWPLVSTAGLGDGGKAG